MPVTGFTQDCRVGLYLVLSGLAGHSPGGPVPEKGPASMALRGPPGSAFIKAKTILWAHGSSAQVGPDILEWAQGSREVLP